MKKEKGEAFTLFVLGLSLLMTLGAAIAHHADRGNTQQLESGRRATVIDKYGNVVPDPRH